MAKKNYPAGKLDLEKLKDTIYDWIKKRTEGLIEQESILFRDQSQALPPRPCVTMKFTSGPLKTGFTDNLVVDPASGKTNVGGQRVMILSVQVFGSSNIKTPIAPQLAADLRDSLDLPTVLEQLRAGGIAVWNQGEVTNLTDLEETEFEDRAEFSVMLGVAQNQVDDPGYFDEVGPIAKTITNC